MTALFLAITIARAPKRDRERSPVWSVTCDGRVIVSRSKTPLYDAGRLFLAEGCDPARQLLVHRQGEASETTTVGAAAGIDASMIVRTRDGPGALSGTVTYERPKPWPSRIVVTATYANGSEASTELDRRDFYEANSQQYLHGIVARLARGLA